MNIEYSMRAIADLEKVAADSQAYGPEVLSAIGDRFQSVFDRISQDPQSSPGVQTRPGVRVAFMGRYPYKIFYRIISDETIRILHIRHTSRQPWAGA